MLRKDSLVRGAFILAVGALVSRLFGGIYRFLLPALMGGGEEGAYAVGLFGYAYQIYIVALTISTVGLPLAVSKLISERLASGDGPGAARIFTTSRLLLGGLGLALTAAMVLGGPIFARFVDANAIYSVYAIAPAVFIVALTSAYRGLFQGMQVMKPYAVSQVVEQIVRVATILLAAMMLRPHGIPLAAAGANFGAVTGAVVALAYLLLVYRRNQDNLNQLFEDGNGEASGGTAQIIRELLALAIPISLAGLAYPLFNLVDLSVPVRLQQIGLSRLDATAAYGALTQQAAPFLNVPLTFTTGFALSLVPAIAEAAATGNKQRVRRGTGAALRIALLITLPAAAGLAVLAEDLAGAFYNYPAAGVPLRVLAIAALFIGLQQMSSGVLQGLGRPLVPVRNLMAAVVVKAVLTWILVGLPGWGVAGAALATVAGFTVTGILNLLSVRKYAGGLGITAGQVVRPLLAALLMVAVVSVVRDQLLNGVGLSLLVTTLAAVGAGIVAYGVFVLLVGGVSSKDLELAPGLERRFGPWLRRWRLIRD